MRVFRALHRATIPLVLVAGGCNAISGLDADYEVGSSVPADGGLLDTGGGGSTFDVLTNEGGGTDPGPIPCPAGSLFCDDFEDTTKATIPFGWNRSETNGGNPRLEAAAGFGSTRGLRAEVNGGGFSGKVALWKVVDTTFAASRRMSLSFHFKVVKAEIDYTVIGAIQLNGSEYGLAVYRNPRCPNAPAPCLDENQPSGQHAFTAAIPLAADIWQRADVSIVRTATTYEGRVTINGSTVLHDGVTTLEASNPRGPGVEIGVGAFFTGPNGVTETFIDDVVVRYE
jgi:hypothetical protein